jgi:BirA family transcriptional regulator, biotin operon repressor / biotin---[acetyl-CoA-carboxylase] ligase
MNQQIGHQFSRSDIDRIVAETFIGHVEYYPELASTNCRALQLANELPGRRECTLVLADEQTAGRGRGTNRWWSGPGALTFSVLLEPQAIHLPANRWPQVSLAAGLAVCDAIEGLVDDVTTCLKWPNDVYLCGRKICGILVEAANGQLGCLVLGIGVNVNNSVENAPEELRTKALSLSDVAEREISCIDMLVGILQQLSSHLEQLASGDGTLRERWRKRCSLTGRTVHIQLGTRRLVGICRGIDDDGALVLETDIGRERCISGVVVQVG